MTKFLILLVLLFYSYNYSQDLDTLFQTINPDSVIVNDTTAVQDTVGIIDSAKTSAIVDTLYPVKQRVLYDGSDFTGQENLKKIYSGYEGNYFSESEKIFIRDYSFIGYPDEVVYYGTSGISFLEDGLSLTGIQEYENPDRYLLESVDSIEFIPAVRGFLYGNSFNHTSINLLSKDFLSQAPYTRIKYYEGPFGEAMINGLFNSVFINRLNIYADFTNRSTDIRYANTDLSTWKVKLKAKYFLSNNYNLLASYNFNSSLAGLNGGVDADSILLFSTNLDATLYDEVLAPVIFDTRQLQEKQHFFRLRLLATPIIGYFSDINLYYGFSLNRIYKNEDVEANDFALKNKRTGILIDQRFKINPVEVDLKGIYDRSDLLINYYDNASPVKTTQNIYSFSAFGYAFFLDSIITPSVFYRYAKTSAVIEDDQQGIGADIIIRPLDYLQIYTGYSLADNFSSDTRGSIFETGLKMNFNFLSLKAGYYKRDKYLQSLQQSLTNYQNYFLLGRNRIEANHSGINANAEIRIWSLLLSSSIIYPFAVEGTNVKGLPEITSRSGIFFNDILFNNNLDLKTGFVFYYWGEQFLENDDGPVAGHDPLYYFSEAYKIDFTLTGEIQKSAILYFIWENITANEYYITPYYPMPFSGIKFGVSWELFN